MHSIGSEPEIVAFAFGSTGDILPCLALARGLQADGFPVKFVTHARFGSLAASHGLRTVLTDDDPHATLLTKAGRRWLDSGTNPLASGLSFRRILESVLRQYGLLALAEGRGARAIVASGLACFPVAHVAEKLNIPFFPAYLQPMTATTQFRNPFVSHMFADGALGNLLTHFVFRHGGRALYRSSVNRMRNELLGLAPVAWNGPFPEWHRNAPILYGYSPTVLPKPHDWPKSAHVTGYWFLPPEEWQPSAGLAAFLESGPPPVCVGFGSMTDRNPDEMTAIVLAALDQAKCRGILLTGWGALTNASLPDHVFKLESAPHEWLFPRTSAVVHHGGAGTTAAAFRAGVPAVMVPYFGDQFFWSSVAYNLGVCSRPIFRKNLTARALASAILEIAGNSAMARRAEAVARQIRAENGVQNAVQAVRNHLGRKDGESFT